jgi:hypothetical protein
MNLAQDVAPNGPERVSCAAVGADTEGAVSVPKNVRYDRSQRSLSDSSLAVEHSVATSLAHHLHYLDHLFAPPCEQVSVVDGRSGAEGFRNLVHPSQPSFDFISVEILAAYPTLPIAHGLTSKYGLYLSKYSPYYA